MYYYLETASEYGWLSRVQLVLPNKKQGSLYAKFSCIAINIKNAFCLVYLMEKIF